jgi:hypothetical protein
VIYHIVQQYFSAARLEKVRLEETSMNSFEYLGEEPESERDAALVSAGAKEKAK